MAMPTATTPGYGLFRGRVACDCLRAWLPVFEAELLRRGGSIKHSIDIAQLTGGAAASGGTHSQGGVFDIWQTQAIVVWVARQMGADATWHRPPNWDNAGGSEHTHGVLRGCPHNTPARYQIDAVDAGYNGLGAGGRYARDTGPRPLSHRTWKEGIAWAKAQQPSPFSVRLGSFNWPGSDKLPNTAARVKVGAELVASAHLDVVGLQELIGRRAEGKASTYALQVRDAVREATNMDWHLSVPKGPNAALSENYALTRRGKLEVASQWQDVVLRPSGVGGRHLMRLVLRDVDTKRKLGLGVTHLVSDDRPGARRQSPLIAKAMTGIIRAHDCPVLVTGDMNLSDDLKGLLDAGYGNTRKMASSTTRTDRATYTRIDKTRPSMNTDFRLDQTYVTRDGATVTGQTLVQDLVDGEYRQPRASDHDLLVTAVRFE